MTTERSAKTLKVSRTYGLAVNLDCTIPRIQIFLLTERRGKR